MDSRIKKIAIVGGGTAGYISALTLKHRMPELEVTVIQSKTIPVIGVGEATTPWFLLFLHQILGLPKGEFYEKVRPVWKLGNRLEWGRVDFNYPFGGQYMEARVNRLPRESAYYLMKYGLGPANLYAGLMDAKKSPMTRTPEGKVLLDQRHAYHIENERFIEYLEEVARRKGVVVLEGLVKGATRKGDGDVESLVLDDGRVLEADFFVDCSGFKGVLIDEVLDEEFVSYGDSLFCDSAVIGHWQRDGEILPYTTATTMEHGWCWRTEFEHHVNRGYVYSSDFCDEETAAKELKAKNPEIGDELNFIKFPSGRRKNFWVGNVAAVGNAAGFVEPLEATNLQMISITALTLTNALYDTNCVVKGAMTKMANGHIHNWWEDVRGFLAIHFKFNTRLETPFWKHCVNDTNLAGASDFVEAYQETGPSGLLQTCIKTETVFGYGGYIAMMVAQQVETAYEAEYSEGEKGQWEAALAHVGQNATQALTMREALRIVHDKRWQWG